MENTVTFSLKLNLQRFSAIAMAIHLWNKPYLRKERTKFFKAYVDQYRFKDLYVKWSTVMNLALKYVKNLHSNLPEKVASQLESMMVYIGDKIFDWVSYIVKSYHFGLRCTETIYWTSQGTVNEVKVLKSVWAKDPDFPCWADSSTNNREQRLLLRFFYYNAICVYAQTDMIEPNKKEIIKILKMKEYYGNELKLTDKATSFEIMGTVLCIMLASTEMQPPIDFYRMVFEEGRASPSVCLFFGSVEAATDRTIKYFYEYMTKKEREEYLPHAARNILGQRFEIDENGSIYKKERITVSILFFINSMSDKQKCEYLLERGVEVCKIFITVPPYDQLCHPILEYVWKKFPKRNHNPMKENLLKFTFDLLRNFPETSHSSKKEVQQQFFEFLLKNTENNLKKKIIIDGKIPSFSKLFKLHDFYTLKVIINDSDLAYARDEILAQGTETIQHLAEKGEFALIDKSLNDMLLTNDEKKKIKEALKFTASVLINGKIELADKFLNWKSSSRKAKLKLKNLINPFDVYSELIRKRLYNLANEYLMWQLDYSVDDQNFVKQDLRSKILLTELCKLWCEEFNGGIGNAKAKCTQLIKFFKVPDEKPELIENEEEFVRIFFQNVPSLDCARMIDDLLRFCLKSADRIKGLKQKIAADIDSWIEFFGLKENKFLIANCIIFWLFKGDKKDAVIKNFINSMKGAELCVKVLTGTDEKSVQMVVAVYNNWVRRFGDAAEIKNHVEIIYSQSAEKSVLGAKALLDKLRDGKEINSNTAKNFMNIEKEVEDVYYDEESASYVEHDFDPCRLQ